MSTISAIKCDAVAEPAANVCDEALRYERFLDLFTSERDGIYGYIFSILPNHADAEDVFQKCCIVLWRKLDLYVEGSSFLGWACTVAHYEVLNFRRSEQHDRHYFSQDLVDQLSQQYQGPRDSTNPKSEALRACLQKLRNVDRELLDKLYCSDQSLADHAKTTGKALQSLYNRAGILRRKLCECVQRSMEFSGADS
ncbi:sigma-70 family RNA polymerase sigma factor [Allorhodopirellula solitaria]|uniref:RNA polymerase sigma factor n=1 Tax=Allorhodopirellula solitaria TaxID=2527987 RepID=A0A5C5XVU5_9BACT|nr:sigma-70 family RNA polymerase sigma factor [Allorhodopirellula solitaria]TWT67447.1 RNA polymerase sigma factor [Allorhodopirellula solitaria]